MRTGPVAFYLVISSRAGLVACERLTAPRGEALVADVCDAIARCTPELGPATPERVEVELAYKRSDAAPGDQRTYTLYFNGSGVWGRASLLRRAVPSLALHYGSPELP